MIVCVRIAVVGEYKLGIGLPDGIHQELSGSPSIGMKAYHKKTGFNLLVFANLNTISSSRLWTIIKSEVYVPMGSIQSRCGILWKGGLLLCGLIGLRIGGFFCWGRGCSTTSQHP
jgi:hypothetical protein